jgi:uncharacterized protein YjiS (DUF1127 family)
MMRQIKNIRFTYQYRFRMVSWLLKPGGISGGSSGGRGPPCARFTTEAAMTLYREIILQIAPLPRAVRALGTAIAVAVTRAAKILRHRRDLEFLAGLDDHMLKDIGLNRGDLRFALTEPFWRDVGAALISRVGERGIHKDRPTSVPSIVPAALGWTEGRIVPPLRARRRAA